VFRGTLGSTSVAVKRVRGTSKPPHESSVVPLYECSGGNDEPVKPPLLTRFAPYLLASPRVVEDGKYKDPEDARNYLKLLILGVGLSFFVPVKP